MGSLGKEGSGIGTARFDGKVVVVTGAGSGIGAATAERFAGDGAAVLLADINRDRVDGIAERVRRLGRRAIAMAADVADEQAVQAIVDRAVKDLGGLNVMINNAGVGELPTPIEQKPAADWNRVISINLTGTFYGIKHAARVMKAAGRPGVIINVASILGVVGFRGAPAYTASKHAILGLTKAAALELAAVGIRVLAVEPAFIRTPLIQGMEDAVLPLHPIGRLGSPEEVASLLAFLASDDAGFVTGAGYLIDGGYTAQ
jgi:NAD(P)-dependent dehydrogenase (short-subunit alcohol dehydrogenase family)